MKLLSVRFLSLPCLPFDGDVAPPSIQDNLGRKIMLSVLMFVMKQSKTAIKLQYDMYLR